MTIDEAIAYFNEARSEERLRLKVCEDWTEAHGLDVWFEKHPADLEKLADYRKALWWRQEAKCRLREALQATLIERGHA
jgi:hypothetical protein